MCVWGVGRREEGEGGEEEMKTGLCMLRDEVV